LALVFPWCLPLGRWLGFLLNHGDNVNNSSGAVKGIGVFGDFKLYHYRLRTDRKIEEALRLCDGIEDEAIRNALRTKLALHFAGLDGTDGTLQMILGYPAVDTTSLKLSRPVAEQRGTTEAG
jgi:hypothetical protein